METRFLIDANRDYAQVLEEYNPTNGNVIVSYVYGHDLISQNRSNNKSFYLYDGLGSVKALTNPTGNVTDRYNYDAYGNLISVSGTSTNNYRFTGEQLDSATGDYYLRDRYYGTDIGRFTRADRWEGNFNNPVTLNRYLYGLSDPLNKIDLSGLIPVSIAETSSSNTFISLVENVYIAYQKLRLAETAYSLALIGLGAGSSLLFVNQVHTKSGSLLAINEDKLRSETENIAIHLARLLGEASVGGIPPEEDPENGNQNDNHWWQEIKAFAKNIQQAIKGASRKQVMRDLVKKPLKKTRVRLDEPKIMEIDQKLGEAAQKMGQQKPDFLPLN